MKPDDLLRCPNGTKLELLVDIDDENCCGVSVILHKGTIVIRKDHIFDDLGSCRCDHPRVDEGWLYINANDVRLAK